MAIEQERIEAAARAMMVDPKLWDISTESYRDEWRDRALDVLAAAFPELASDPPTGWVAPINATAIMQEAADLYLNDLGDGKAEWDGLVAARLWGLMTDAARDAHTKEQT